MQWVRVGYLRFEGDYDKVVEITPYDKIICVDDGEDDTVFHDLQSAIKYLRRTFNITLEVPKFETIEGFWFEAERVFGRDRVFVRRQGESPMHYDVVMLGRKVDGFYDLKECTVSLSSDLGLLSLTEQFFEEYHFVPENDVELISFVGSTQWKETNNRKAFYFPTLDDLKDDLESRHGIEM